MSEVKRYTVDCATCSDVVPAVTISSCKMVRAEDYAALEAECERLNRESQNLSDQLGRCDRDKRQAIDQLAALKAPAVADGEFGAEQWWFAELDAALSSGTADQRRALAVVRNLLGQFAAVTAERDAFREGRNCLVEENTLLYEQIADLTEERDQLRAMAAKEGGQ